MSKKMQELLKGTMAEAMNRYLTWSEGLWEDSPVPHWEIDPEPMIKHNIYCGLIPEAIAELPQLYGPGYFFDKEKSTLVWRSYCLCKATDEMYESHKVAHPYEDEANVRMGWRALCIEALAAICEVRGWEFQAGIEKFNIIYPEATPQYTRTFEEPDFYSRESFYDLMNIVCYE